MVWVETGSPGNVPSETVTSGLLHFKSNYSLCPTPTSLNHRKRLGRGGKMLVMHSIVFVCAVLLLLCTGVTAQPYAAYIDDKGVKVADFMTGDSVELANWKDNGDKDCIPFSFASQPTLGEKQGYVSWTCKGDSAPNPIYIYDLASASGKYTKVSSTGFQLKSKSGLAFEGDSLYFNVFLGSAWSGYMMSVTDKVLPNKIVFAINGVDEESGGGSTAVGTGTKYVSYTKGGMGWVESIGTTTESLAKMSGLWSNSNTPLTAAHRIGTVAVDETTGQIAALVTKEGAPSDVFLLDSDDKSLPVRVTGVTFPDYEVLGPQETAAGARQPSIGFVPGTRDFMYSTGSTLVVGAIDAAGVFTKSREFSAGGEVFAMFPIKYLKVITDVPPSSSPPTPAPTTAAPTAVSDTSTPAPMGSDVTPAPTGSDATPAPATPLPDGATLGPPTQAPCCTPVPPMTPPPPVTRSPITYAPYDPHGGVQNAPSPDGSSSSDEKSFPFGSGEMYSFILCVVGVVIMCCGIAFFCYSKSSSKAMVANHNQNASPDNSLAGAEVPLTCIDSPPNSPTSIHPTGSALPGENLSNSMNRSVSVNPMTPLTATGSMHSNPRRSMRLATDAEDIGLSYSHYKRVTT